MIILNARDKIMTKTFTKDTSERGYEKKDYDRAWEFECEDVQLDNIADLYETLLWLSAESYRCVIRGKLRAGQNPQNVNRRKHDRDDVIGSFEMDQIGQPWLMCDFDSIPVPDWLTKDTNFYLEYLISMLPEYMHHASYIYQWSSQAGLDGWKTLRCHIWFWMSEPRTDEQLVNWAKSVIFDQTTGKHLDDSPMRTVQPNYTASPIFKGLEDPIETRVGLVVKELDEVLLPIIESPVPIKTYRTLSSIMNNSVSCTNFDDYLKKIGPDYHMPITQAVASWIASTGPGSDLCRLKERLREAILNGPGEGSAGIKHYLSDRYLDEQIRGCPFPPKPNGPNRLPETPKEKMIYLLSKKLNNMTNKMKEKYE